MGKYAAYLAERIDAWDFRSRPEHCTNCKHATVRGDSDDPYVVCEAGHGKPIPLFRMLNTISPTVFRAAILCPDFERMDE